MSATHRKSLGIFGLVLFLTLLPILIVAAFGAGDALGRENDQPAPAGDTAVSPPATTLATGPSHPYAPQSTFIDSGQTLGGSAWSSAVALGDLDADGDLDAVVATSFGGPSKVYLNQGGAQGGTEGVFLDSGQSLSDTALDVELGDLDGDTDLDAFLVRDADGESNAVWLNQGVATGVFSQTNQIFGDERSSSVALGDLDGVGGLDAFVGRFLGEPSKVWFNDGSGIFGDSGQTLDDDSLDLALGDLDGDGDLDAFSANGTNNKVWVNLGGEQDGEPGVFIDGGQSMGSVVSWSVVLGDVDGDGDLDAYAGNDLSDQLWINQGGAQGGTEGVFFFSAQSLSDDTTRDVSLADLDADGDLDAFLAKDENEVWINQGGSQGGTEGTLLDSGQSLGLAPSEGLALGDVDGDGDLDAFVANEQDPDRVWLNQTGATGPDAESWQVSTVTTRGDSGQYVDMVLDQNGHPHLSYVTFISVASGLNDTLWYAHWDGVRWETQHVDRAPSIASSYGQTSLVMDSAGRPHIAYAAGRNRSNLRLRYAQLIGNGWVTQTVSADTDVSRYVSLALDSSDTAHISYFSVDFSGDPLHLKYAVLNGGAWQIEEVYESNVSGTYNSLALDGNGRPHVAFYDHTSEDILLYAHDGGGGWQTEVVEASNPDAVGTAAYPSLALDGNDRPHIAYNGNSGYEVRYAKKVTTSWQVETAVNLPLSARSSGRVSLILDSGDNPRVAFARRKFGGERALAYAAWDGAFWQTQIVDNNGADLGRYNALALDAAGKPHIGYYDAFYGDLRFASKAPAWITETLKDTGQIRSPALAVQDAQPSVGYYDQSSGQVEVTFWNGIWEFAPLAFVSNPVDQVSMDASLNKAHLSYYDADNQRLVYVSGSGSTWSSMAVDSSGDVGKHNDLVVVGDADALVRIAYWDVTNSQVKLARIDGSNLRVYSNTVGPVLNATSGPLAATVLPAGDIGVSYYDGVNGDLRFARLDLETETWTDELVDGISADVGRLNAVETDGSEGVPVFAYYDETNDAIKFAYEQDGAFYIEVAVPSAGLVNSLSMELGLNSRLRPRIAYTTQAGNAVYFATKPQGTWQVENVDQGSSLSDVSLDLNSRPYLAYVDNGLYYAFRSATIDVDTAQPGAVPRSGPGYYNPLDACQAVLDLFIPQPESLVPTRFSTPRVPSSQHEPLSDLAVFGGMTALFNGTSGGQFYIDLYRQHGTEMGQLGLDDPALIWDAYGTLQNFMPGLEALVMGRGDEVLVTQQMVDDALDIWQRLAAAGSPALASTINSELAKYNNLQDFVGASFDEWAQALGVATERVYLPVVRED